MNNTLKIWLATAFAAMAASPLAAQEAVSFDQRVNDILQPPRAGL